jgi:chromosomal replication initiation ATPase DnaA
MRQVDTQYAAFAPSPDLILETVAAFTNSSVELIVGPRREPRIVASRDVAAYMLRFVGLLSWSETARHLNRVDGSSAFTATTRVMNRIDSDADVSKAVEMISDKITAIHELERAA